MNIVRDYLRIAPAEFPPAQDVIQYAFHRISGCPLQLIPGLPLREHRHEIEGFIVFRSPVDSRCQYIQYLRVVCAIVAPVDESVAAFTRQNFRWMEADFICLDNESQEYFEDDSNEDDEDVDSVYDKDYYEDSDGVDDDDNIDGVADPNDTDGTDGLYQ